MSELKTVKELFESNFFRVPDYQRGYAWTKDQLNDLWMDIESLSTDSKHYMGSLYVEDKAGNVDGTDGRDVSDAWLKDGRFVEVVDGQQRLTTLAILLFVLIKASDGHGYLNHSVEELENIYLRQRNRSSPDTEFSYKFSYHDGGKLYREFLLGTVFEEKFVASPNLNSLYTVNLRTAKQFFEDRVCQLDYGERERLFRIIVRSLVFDYQVIGSDFDVQLVFETMNNRGKPLTNLEKLKNRLMYLTSKINCSPFQVEKLRGEINRTWGDAYEKLASDLLSPLDEDEFLAAHLSLYRRPTESVFSVEQAASRLFKMFSIVAERFARGVGEGSGREPCVSYDKIYKYVIDLRRFLNAWVAIHHEVGLCQKILRLNSSREVKILLCALWLSGGENGMEKLEKVLFRNSVPGGWLIDNGSLATDARELYVRMDNIDGIESCTLKEVLEDWEKASSENPINLESVALSFARLYDYQRGPKGFHRWRGLKYFLFSFEEYLASLTKEGVPRVELDRFAETSIEHVMPQDCTKWKKHMDRFLAQMPADELIRADAEKTLINSLGNLTILGASTNSSLHNDAWEGAAGKRAVYLQGSYSELQIAKCESWTSREILARGRALLQFLAMKLEAGEFSEEQIKTALLYKKVISDSVDLPPAEDSMCFETVPGARL